MSQSDGVSHRIALGRSGEDLAVSWYLSKGYKVIERNWRCREGEIDIVATKGQTLVICEVKTRTSNRFGMPAEAVTFFKQARLRKLAVKYLTTASRAWNIRFDVVSVMAGKVEVLEDAF